MAKKKVMLSDGHGKGTPGKRTPDGYQENSFNSAVVKLLEVELERCGFEVKQAAPTDADTPLKTRSDLSNSWGSDIYVAVHYNALDDKWRSGEGGIETYYYPGSSKGSKLANAIHKELMKGTKMRDRGVKEGNLHEVREPNCPAALVEAGFMDIKREADLMKSPAYHKECAMEIAKGICNYFDVKYIEYVPPKPEPPKPVPVKPASPNSTDGIRYRVVAGTFANRDNADNLAKELKNKGFDSAILPYKFE